MAPESRVTGPELGGGARLTVRALGAEERVIWLLDGLPAGLSHPGEPIAIALGAPGRKSLLAIDRAGRVARVDFSFLGLAARQGGP
ncbi:MAG: hypothetical protein RML12_08705 [Xanthomonadales bacterium]|nr:hypothetical protein [Xanthomonadales bacterium]